MIIGLKILIFFCFVAQGATPKPLERDLHIAIGLVRGWVTQGLVVGSGEKILSDGVSGVCVLLRSNGTLIGYGEAFGSNQNLLTKAANIAFGEARKNSILRSLPEEIRNHAMPSIGIEVGIAGVITPIPSKHIERAAKNIVAGLDGLAVRRGKNWDYRFPSQMRLSPFRTTVNHFEGMCIKVGAPASAVIAHQLPQTEDTTLYKIEFLSGYQDRGGDKVVLLYRGDEHVSLMKLKQEGLQNIADLLALYIIHSVWPGEEFVGITGTYQPEIDNFSVIIAPVISQAMSAEALLSYAQMRHSKHKKEAMDAYVRIMNDLAIVNGSESPIEAVSEHSFIVLASTGAVALTDEAAACVEECKRKVISAAMNMANKSTIPEKPYVRAVLAAAVSRIAAQEQDPVIISLAEKVIDVCVLTTNDHERASLIPWIAQACVDVMNVGGKVDVQMITTLWKDVMSTQVTVSEIPDLLGGFLLTTPSGSIVDARGIRMLPMLAELLPIEGFTPREDRSDALQSLLLAARFTSQLTTTPDRASRFPNPAKATGGVRSATWDATMKPEAAAMALIGITSAIETIYTVAHGG